MYIRNIGKILAIIKILDLNGWGNNTETFDY